MINFEDPFALGIAWFIILVVLLVLLIRTEIAGARRDHVIREQSQAHTTLQIEVAALRERARSRDREIDLEHQLSKLQVASEQERGADFRFRAQGIAKIVMALEDWLKVTLTTLEQHALPIPVPPPFYGRVRHEGDAFPLIDEAREARLDAMIRDYEDSLGGIPWESEEQHANP
jgi:hypothetical protein